MPRAVRAAALATLVALAGCRFPTPAEKEASFAPYARARVGGVELGGYLGARTAVIMQGVAVLRVVTATALTTSLETEGAFSLGVATAVAPDGYFLTAAHCAREPVTMLVRSGGSVVAVRPRVVLADDDVDLALLKVDGIAGGGAFFEWSGADEVGERTELVSLGLGGETGPSFRFVAAAGRALETPEAPSGGEPPVSIVRHDVLLNHGDSGGPLATCGGRLVGVNVGIWARCGFPPWSDVAIRPDPAWVEARMAADRRAH